MWIDVQNTAMPSVVGSLRQLPGFNSNTPSVAFSQMHGLKVSLEITLVGPKPLGEAWKICREVANQ
jgi:hypothetical protein